MEEVRIWERKHSKDMSEEGRMDEVEELKKGE